MHKGVKSSVIYSWAAALFTYQCILLLRLVSCAAHCTVAVSISCIHLITVAAHQKLSATALLEWAMHESECAAEQEQCSAQRESRVGESNSEWAALTERSGSSGGSTIVALFCASVAIINYISSLWPNNFLFLDFAQTGASSIPQHTDPSCCVAASIKWLITRMHRNCHSEGEKSSQAVWF